MDMDTTNGEGAEPEGVLEVLAETLPPKVSAKPKVKDPAEPEVKKDLKVVMARHDFGSEEVKNQLLTNHLKTRRGLGKVMLDKVSKTLFPYGALPSNKMDILVILEEVSTTRRCDGNVGPSNGARRRPQTAMTQLQVLANAERRYEPEQALETTRVLDILLRQHTID